MGEADDELVDDAVHVHGAGDGHDLGVDGPAADERVAVEAGDLVAPEAAGQDGNVRDVRLVDHRRHRGVEVALDELGADVFVEDITEVGRHVEDDKSRVESRRERVAR